MTDAVIIQEAIRLVDDGVSVTFPVKGRSMLPFIIGGRESVILTRPEGLRVGHIVLAWIPPFSPEAGGRQGRYVVHRIISVTDGRVVLMGDGNIVGTEHCALTDVKALATHVVDGRGQRHELYTPWRQRGSRLWWRLRPVRRYILFIYRKVKGIK